MEQGRRRRDFGGLAGVICRCDRCEVGDLEGLGDEGDSGCGGQAAWTEHPSHARTTHCGDDLESNSPVTHRPSQQHLGRILTHDNHPPSYRNFSMITPRIPLPSPLSSPSITASSSIDIQVPSLPSYQFIPAPSTHHSNSPLFTRYSLSQHPS